MAQRRELLPVLFPHGHPGGTHPLQEPLHHHEHPLKMARPAGTAEGPDQGWLELGTSLGVAGLGIIVNVRHRGKPDGIGTGGACLLPIPVSMSWVGRKVFSRCKLGGIDKHAHQNPRPWATGCANELLMAAMESTHGRDKMDRARGSGQPLVQFTVAVQDHHIINPRL